MKTRIFNTTALVLFAVLMFCGSTNAKGKTFRLASSLENEMDPALKIENWMVNDFVWSRNANFLIAEEIDETLEIESWMTHSLYWEKIEKVQDEQLSLEPWMYDETNWLPAGNLAETAEDDVCMLEAWMTDDDFWR